MNGHALKLIAAFCLCLAGAFLAFRFFGPIGGGPDVKQERQSANASATQAQSRPAPILEAATGAHVQERINSDLAAGRPIVVHVVTALCDNKYQGIVRVPKRLGNGQDPRSNLYWGAMYGVRSFLTKKARWKVRAEPAPRAKGVLDKIVMHTAIRRSGRQADVYMVAEAWDGKEIKAAIGRFLSIAAGHYRENIKVDTPGGSRELRAGGAAHLVVYVGHNGLMDFSLEAASRRSPDTGARSSAVLCCKSKPYFLEKLRRGGSHPMLLTTGLMAPEAYTLDALVRSWAAGDKPDRTRDSAAAAYHKYQKCGLNAAKRLFSFQP